MLILVSTALSLIALTIVAWNFMNFLWLRPRKLEHFLRKQGFGGNSYRPINGDLAEMNQMTQSAISKPMSSLSHDLTSRIGPFLQQTVNQHGENSFVWYGTKPKVNIMKPDLIREIFTKYDIFRKQSLGTRSRFGLVMRDGEDWAKNMLPLMEVSVDTMLGKWEEMIQAKEVTEVDVYSSLSSMAGDVIARTAFGSSYEQESNEKDIEEHGVGISMEELIAECRLFLLAGKDTTASLLTWTLVLLTQHQDWQTKAREEVFQHFGKDNVPHFEGLNSLKIVNMILHETLRFYPPVPGLSRIIAHDTKLKSIALLHEMEVNIPTLLVHRDPKNWGDDVNEFNPSRFAKGVSSAANVPGSFLPFGGGPRVCVGQNFALIEAKLALAKILQRFTFQLSPSYTHAPIPLVGLVPQFGAPLILNKI
ncbi:hypothetical protein KSS87_011479 [Heliosperma pusillum]|nr:hypothetical protein KSS87_011479 [Heliosperma pusillum]